MVVQCSNFVHELKRQRKQKIMRTLETRININANAEQVWNVLTDFGSYPNWNPFVINVSGKTEVGEQIEVDLKMEGSKPQTFKPEVLVNDKDREFRWIGKLFVKGLFDGEHYFKLKEVDGMVELTHGENFSGAFVALVLSLIGEKTEAGFKAMNHALKSRVEQLSN